MNKADHSGHRSRMKKKLIEKGMDMFEPHEVLEILLYYAIPQRNTNDIAKNLIAHYGSLYAVFEASLSSLKNFGLTEHQALLIKMVPDLARVYLADKAENCVIRFTPDSLKDYVFNRFIGFEKEEHVLLLMLDKGGRMVYCDMIAEGDMGSAKINVRKIVSLAVDYAGVYIYIAHNHPSGSGLPSREDYLTTLSLKKSLKLIRAELVDHFLIAGGECISMAESGVFDFE